MRIIISYNLYKFSKFWIKYCRKEKIKYKVIIDGFETQNKLKMQCLTMNVIYYENKYSIVKLSYHFSVRFCGSFSGCWCKNLSYYEDEFNLQKWVLESFLKYFNLKFLYRIIL